MLVLADPVQTEYHRCLDRIGADDPYVSQSTLGIHDVLRAHFLIADYFYELGTGLGGIGPKDENLLHSALGRQIVSFGGKQKWSTNFEICATLFYGLIMDHPFHDANKRTAFLSCLYHLQKYNLCPTISHKEFEDFTVEVADHAIKNRKRYIALKKDGDPDPEVKFISKFLRQNTRKIENTDRTITFRELKTILNGFNFDLENPTRNHIDIVKIIQKRRLIFGEKYEVRQKVGRIGFPSWTKQVSKKDLKYAREMAKLDFKNNHVDSRTFFAGLDDIRPLLSMYQEPLVRLANR